MAFKLDSTAHQFGLQTSSLHEGVYMVRSAFEILQFLIRVIFAQQRPAVKHNLRAQALIFIFILSF